MLGDTVQRGKSQFGLINSGGTYEQAIDSIDVFNDGKHVDVVICDDPVSYDCQEWFSPTTGQTRFVQYDWYSNLNTLVQLLMMMVRLYLQDHIQTILIMQVTQRVMVHTLLEQ